MDRDHGAIGDREDASPKPYRCSKGPLAKGWGVWGGPPAVGFDYCAFRNQLLVGDFFDSSDPEADKGTATEPSGSAASQVISIAPPPIENDWAVIWKLPDIEQVN